MFLSVFSIADSVPHWLSKYVLLLFHRRKKAKKWWNSVNLLPNWKNSKHLKSTSFQSNSRYCNLQSLMWCVCLNYTTAIYNLLMSLCSPYCYFFYSSSSKSISLWGCWFFLFFFLLLSQMTMTAWHTTLMNVPLEIDQTAALLPILPQGITKSPLILFIL